MTKYPQFVQILHILMEILAMDAMSSTSHTQRTPMGFNSNMHADIICVHPTNERKLLENVAQVYLLGTLTHKGGSIAILSDNGTEFKNTILNESCEHLCIKKFFQPHSTHKAT